MWLISLYNMYMCYLGDFDLMWLGWLHDLYVIWLLGNIYGTYPSSLLLFC